MAGWTVTQGSVDVILTYWSLPPGIPGNSLDMNGTGPGTITQQFATVANATYVVQFYLSGNPDGNPGLSSDSPPNPATKVLDVSATGTPMVPYDYTVPQGTTEQTMQWTGPLVYSFVATSDTTTLTFAGDPTNLSAYGPALGGVSVTETAATGASCKDGGWATMYEPTGTPFKNQGDCVSYYAISGATPIGS